MAYLLLAVAAAGLIRFSLVWNFVTDDAFISFVYARNLVEHGELVFNLGERVEGYTNFLWTILIALGLRLGVPAEDSARVMGTAAGIGTMIIAAFLMKRLRGDVTRGLHAWDAVPALLLAAIPGYACWSSGGLETQLFTLLVVAGGHLYLKELEGDAPPRWSALLFGLSALTRPEGVLVFALTAAHRGALLLLQRNKIRVGDFVWGAIFLAIVVPHFVWRKQYYGWWLPNTFYIKSSGGAGTWDQGGYYIWSATKQFHLWAPLLIGGIGLVVGQRTRAVVRFASYALLVALTYLLYVAKVGGDFMGLFRFIMPPIVLLYLFGAMGLYLLLQPRGNVAIAVIAAVLGLHVAHAVPVAKASLSGSDRGIDSPGWLRGYTADRAVIGKWFGQYRQPDDFMAVGGAGAQVYYAKMGALDCYGLSDAYIAHEVKPVSNRPGHQKYAPLEYQLKRKPTIITSNYYRIQNTPYVPSRAEVEEWRKRGFHYVSVEMPGLSARYYSFLKRLDRAIGPLPAVPDEPEHP